MKKILISTLSLLTIGLGLHIDRINLNPSDMITISVAEARRGHRGGGRRAHKSVHVDVHHRGGRGGAFVAGAVVGAAVVAIGSRHTYLPANCPPYDYYGKRYYQCGGVYYQPVYSGPDVVYVVIEKP